MMLAAWVVLGILALALAAAGLWVAGAVKDLAALKGAIDLAWSDLEAPLKRRQDELEGQAARQREAYNDAVNVFNIRIARFPDNLLAGLLGYQRHDYFR
jgi:hypothetical protein